mmetsp:Transcript_37310/g.106573  ORF Transcript_37310/g.106573 Transcript_37310/m.106573 type:complete len:657 (+) Transcript_37310:44-2014(+)
MESTAAELRLLLDGLLKTVTGRPGELAALPWHKPDTLRDAWVCGVFSLCFFAFNWGLRLLLIEPVARSAFRVRTSKVKKLSQSFMEAVFYGSFTIVGLCVVPQQPYVWPSELWWKGFPEGGHALMRVDMRCYYIMYISRYVQMIVSVLLEPKRKDFGEMILHHVITIAIIYVSYTHGWNRVGVVLMLLFDPADVPLHLAKICKYIAESTKRRVWQKLADRLFESFAVTFFITRLVMFSYFFWSIYFEGIEHIHTDTQDYGGPGGIFCAVTLVMLFLLQLYWFFLICKAAYKMMFSGEGVEDVRSDDDDPPVAQSVGQHTSVSQAVLLLVGLAFGREAWLTMSNLDPALAELGVLLHSFCTMVTGPSSGAEALALAPPDVRRDRPVFAMFATAFFIFNWTVRLLLVEPLVRCALRLRRDQLAKFTQSVMEIIFYGGFTVLGLLVVPTQEWVWPSAKWWLGFADGGHELMRSDLRCYYIMYMARYFQAGVSVLLEVKRSDFFEMLVHHGVTVTVIYISYVYGWNRVGVVVMLLLDPADVPLHLAKLCKYIAGATKRHLWQFIADRLFEVFGIVFFVTRLALYGYVCWSAHIEASRYFPKGLPEWTCVGLLYTLFLLQVYWFYLIVKVAMKLMRGQSVDDPRSDTEEEGGHAPEAKKAR